jgi:protein TonB
MGRDGLRSHLSGTLPISIAVHVAALLAVFIIPLAADVVLPIVQVSLPDYVRAAAVPPPPPVAIRRSTPSPAAVRSDPAPLAPTIAPSAITPEALAPSSVPGPPGVETSNGLPAEAGGLPTGVSPSIPLPPVPVKPAGPVRAGDLPIAPHKVVDARPIYPEIARAARVEGTVVMEAVLDPSGRVTQLRIIKSVPLLDQAAAEAVRQWRYSPSTYGGHPVSVLMTITIRFTLNAGHE